MKEKLIKLLESNDTEDIYNFINLYLNGDSDEFFKLIDKVGIIDDDKIYESLIESMSMSYLSHKYNSNPKQTVNYIINEYFGDIKEINGRYILELGEREDLSLFFKNDGGRDISSKELAKKILGEDWFEPFYDSLQDVYDEVIEVLTPENLKLLAEKINAELSGSKVEPETSLLGDIAEDQGHPDYVELSVDLLLNTIFEEKESTKYILNREAVDTSSELYSLYHNAYNTAYVDEKWEQVSNELKSLLSIDNMGEWQTKTVKGYDGKERKINNYFIDVTNIVDESIKETLDSRYVDDYRNEFEYYGSFESFIEYIINEDIIEGGSISIGYYDYPDSSKVDEYINDLFGDYL